MSQPWLEPYVKVIDENHGYVEVYIDKSELAYVSGFFLQLGTNAKVIKPQKVIDFICKQLQDTIKDFPS